MKKLSKEAYEYLTKELNFSDISIQKIETWYNLLLNWQKKMNLISSQTIEKAWERHFIDSLQVRKYLPEKNKLSYADFGAGAGFPGLAIAIENQSHMTLIEADKKKAIFLSEVIRSWNDTDKINIKNSRIEKLGDIKFDHISARALADLNQLLSWSFPYLKKNGQCLFLKGKKWKDELSKAQQDWNFEYEAHNSITNPEGTIIILKRIEEKT